MATAFPLDVSGAATGSASASGNAAASQLPGYMTSMSNIGANIASETAGEVPDDVIATLKQQGAEQNVTTGAASNAAYLHALGLTSLGLKEQGQKDLESILPSTPGYSVSQNPEFQTSSNLAYEKQLQPQVFARQDQQQAFAVQQQAAALAAAKSGLGSNSGGISWAAPANAWSGGGLDALGFPNTSTATLPGQTAAGGGATFSPWGGGAGGTMTAYGPGGGPGVAEASAPGSAGAFTNWNAWNGGSVYSDPVYAGMNPQEIQASNTPWAGQIDPYSNEAATSADDSYNWD